MNVDEDYEGHGIIEGRKWPDECFVTDGIRDAGLERIYKQLNNS